jgi:mannosyltransferase OCH1-like enzyme
MTMTILFKLQICLLLLLCYLPSAISSSKIGENIQGKDAGFEELLKKSVSSENEHIAIPKIVHFIFGLKGESPPFMIEHYLAIKSAHASIQPEVIYFWYHWEPVSELWFAVKHLVVLKRIELITTVYGNKIEHFAHMADVVRLMILHEFGGIYLVCFI